MKNRYLILFCSLISFTTFSQSKDSLCREFKKDTFYVKIASYLDLHRGDTLADIGGGYGYTILRIAHYTPGVIFYEEDINRWVTNRILFNKTNRNTCTNVNLRAFKYFKGTTTSTKFPDKFFKKVLIAISVHEFEFKEKMMFDVKRIMRSDGRLYIMEAFYKKEAPKEKNCIRPYMLKPDFLALMKNTGFELVKEISLSDGDINEDDSKTNSEHDYKNMTASFFEFKIKQTIE